MATNDLASMPPSGANPMGPAGPEEGGQPVPCLHVYAMPDGTYMVKKDTAPPPPEAEKVGSLQEVHAMLEELGSAEAPEDEAMTAAKTGYAKRSQRPEMMAPGGMFGE